MIIGLALIKDGEENRAARGGSFYFPLFVIAAMKAAKRRTRYPAISFPPNSTYRLDAEVQEQGYSNNPDGMKAFTRYLKRRRLRAEAALPLTRAPEKPRASSKLALVSLPVGGF